MKGWIKIWCLIPIALATIYSGCASSINPAYLSDAYPTMSDQELRIQYYYLGGLVQKGNRTGMDTSNLEAQRNAIRAELIRRSQGTIPISTVP